MINCFNFNTFFKFFIRIFSITFCFIFLFTLNVFAEEIDVSVNGVNLYSKGDYYRSVAAGNVSLSFTNGVLYDDITSVPKNYLLTFCVSENADYSSYYYDGNVGVDFGRGDFSFHITNSPCIIKESHTEGKILYIFGSNTVSSSASGTNATIINDWVIYQYGVVNWSLFSAFFVNEPISIDYSSDGIITTNKEIINQNDTIINQNDTIIDQNTDINNSINDVNSSITNSDVDSPDSKFEEFESMLPENGVITQLITLPVSLFQKVLSSVNGTCSQYNLGSLLGTDLILPCINISNYIGSTLWNVIDILFSGFFVLVIGKKMIKAFNGFTSMKEGDVLD